MEIGAALGSWSTPCSAWVRCNWHRGDYSWLRIILNPKPSWSRIITSMPVVPRLEKTAASTFTLYHGNAGGTHLVSESSLNSGGRRWACWYSRSRTRALWMILWGDWQAFPSRVLFLMNQILHAVVTVSSNSSEHVLLEKQVPKKILEVHEAESVAIKLYIRGAPNFFSVRRAVPKKMSHRLWLNITGFACWWVKDMTMAEVGFCRENILARSPGKKLYLAWIWRFHIFLQKLVWSAPWEVSATGLHRVMEMATLYALFTVKLPLGV